MRNTTATPITPHQQRVYNMVDVKKMLIREVAVELGCTLTATYHALWTARRKLGVAMPPKRRTWTQPHGAKYKRGLDCDEVRCTRCYLGGHTVDGANGTRACDLPRSASAFANQRRTSNMELEH
jgi:hypothetical protein